MDCKNGNTECRWFAMRDLSRSNAKKPAYKLLEKLQFEVFTPMMQRLSVKHGRRVNENVPVIHDLLFVHATRTALDPTVAKTDTLQYRYVRGGYCEPMVVPDADMERFIAAVQASETPEFFSPEDITPTMYGRRVRVIGGALDGYEGHLLSVRGSKHKRLLVELQDFITASVKVSPDLIEILE